MKNLSRTSVETVTVPATEAGRRIDNYLASRLRDLPRSRIYRMLRSGEVRVNGRRVGPDQRIQESDRIRIPPVFIDADTSQPAVIPVARMQVLERAILYEDEGMIILNKPSGLAVHSGSGLAWGVIDVVRAMRPQCDQLQLVHRLDRDTSGCLMLAKDIRTLRELHDHFRQNTLRKTYLAVVCGDWPDHVRRVSQALAKVRNETPEAFVTTTEDGKDATTHVLSVEKYDGCSLVRFGLETGRTHQIRVHAASIGCPVGGDRKYGDETFNRRLREAGCERMLLHAESLTFVAPSGRTVTALPDDAMTRILQRIRAHAF